MLRRLRLHKIAPHLKRDLKIVLLLEAAIVALSGYIVFLQAGV